MTGLVGYNFCSDGNALDPMPTNIENITNTKIQNGIFDHLNITRDVTFDYSSVIPTGWTIDTVMDTGFDGNVSAGNIDQVTEGVTSVRIKRRAKGTFDWITIREIPVSSPNDLSFIITDNLNAYNVEYEYAFVPVMEDVEGQYVVDTILSKFQGVFISDVDAVFKFQAGVTYNTNEQNQQIGVLQPYNRQYPVIVSNSVINYQTGTIGGWVLPDGWEDNRIIDRSEITKEKELLLKFLTNKKPKIIKDMNGNNWLVFFTGNPNLTYDNNFGQGMVKVNAQWTEVGNPNSKDDLYENGMIPTKR